MGKSIWGRTTLIAVLTAASVILVLPSLTDSLPVAWKEKSPKIHLGLDLQGGGLLRLAVESDTAIEHTNARAAGAWARGRPRGARRPGAKGAPRGGEPTRTRIDQSGAREPQIVAEGE